MYRKLVITFLIMLCSFQTVVAQIKEFDKLEMLYDQRHYKMVYRKANRLLDNPEFDFSQIPSLYKSMALFHLSQNEYWLKRKPDALREANNLFVKIKSSSDGIRVFEAHIFEISALKRDLSSWMEDLKRSGKQKTFDEIQHIMVNLFDQVPDVQFEAEIKSEDITADDSDVNESLNIRKQRAEIIAVSTQYVGVPYVWAGSDPKGFDCSGFTSYVMKSIKKELPRRAKEQYENSVKVKRKNVQKGDLIFFDSGSGISHVGIIVSNRGEPLRMIHASSTKGIVITDIESSSYWSKRIVGFGTYLTE